MTVVISPMKRHELHHAVVSISPMAPAPKPRIVAGGAWMSRLPSASHRLLQRALLQVGMATAAEGGESHAPPRLARRRPGRRPAARPI